MRGGDQRNRREVVERREDDDQVGTEPAQGGEGVRGDVSRIDMPRMGGNDGNDLPVNFRELGVIQVEVNICGEDFWVGFIPCARNGRRSKI